MKTWSAGSTGVKIPFSIQCGCNTGTQNLESKGSPCCCSELPAGEHDMLEVRPREIFAHSKYEEIKAGW